jgi:sulfur carrier protein ThiS adenylyltransferase
MTSNHSDRFARQAELVPQDKLAALSATVIGVGAVGRQVALQLAAIGVRRLTIFDFDDVEPTNITTQGYGHADLGLPKVLATAQAITRIDPSIVVTPIPDRFRPRHETGDAVFCAVDKIASREVIWRTVGGSCAFWADGRMLGETLRILVASTDSERRHYKTTLFSAAEAQTGRCTARSTIYVANLCAALMVHQFSRWLRELPLDRDITLNLLASEMIVAGEGQV